MIPSFTPETTIADLLPTEVVTAVRAMPRDITGTYKALSYDPLNDTTTEEPCFCCIMGAIFATKTHFTAAERKQIRIITANLLSNPGYGSIQQLVDVIFPDLEPVSPAFRVLAALYDDTNRIDADNQPIDFLATTLADLDHHDSRGGHEFTRITPLYTHANG